MTKGWRYQSARHSLAAKKIKTGRKKKTLIGKKINKSKLHELATELEEFEDMDLEDEDDIDDIKGILLDMVDAGLKEVKPKHEAMWKRNEPISAGEISRIVALARRK